MRSSAMAAALGIGLSVPAAAQTTGMPSFNAPYRAFDRHEFGGTLSFPNRGDFAVEGQYRFGHRTWDIGFRGGFFDLDGPGADTRVLLGVIGRNRVITHSEAFPLDGAVVVGIGAQLFDPPDPPGSTLYLPIGLSLGRRLDIEDSPVSIVPYAQPTLLFTFNGGSDTKFAFGLGGDFRLSRLFDVRVSVGLGDLEGIAISAVWIH